MELIMMSVGGSLLVLSVQFAEVFLSVRTRLCDFGLKFTVLADPEMVAPGF